MVNHKHASDDGVSGRQLEQWKLDAEFAAKWKEASEAVRADFINSVRDVFRGQMLAQVSAADAARVLQAKISNHEDEGDAMDHSWYKGQPAGKKSRRHVSSKL